MSKLCHALGRANRPVPLAELPICPKVHLFTVQTFEYGTRVKSVARIVNGSPENPGVQHLEPGRPRASSLHDKGNSGGILVTGLIRLQVEGLPPFGVLSFRVLTQRK